MTVETIKWIGDRNGYVDMVDQTLLPKEYRRLAIRDAAAMWDAIKRLAVRGAPALGIAGAFGAVLALKEVPDTQSTADLLTMLNARCDYLANCRPTAVNLGWALNRMRTIAAQYAPQLTCPALKDRLLQEAQAIRDEDAAMCRAIGRHGAALIENDMGILTHCNAGGLATADYGTALAVMFAAQEQGKRFHVFADETRPLLQGARLTSWELLQAGIPVTVICDNMAGFLMKQKRIHAVIVGADRIAANGDTANKIGTYSVAILAKTHNIPFYVAAPVSTFDLTLADGEQIPIEERDPREITHWGSLQTVPDGVRIYNPAFDVTPAGLIGAIITDRGIIKPVIPETIRTLAAASPL